jgi:hypothetical protein
VLLILQSAGLNPGILLTARQPKDGAMRRYSAAQSVQRRRSVMKSKYSRFWWLVSAAVLGLGVVVVGGPAGSAVADQTCPFGQFEDATTPGFQCVAVCPSGTLIDGVTRTCVSAPGLPPPALP